MKSLNIKFPLVDDNNSKRFWGMNVVTKDQISSKLTYLLLTQKGERYYMSDFGTDLLKYVFEPNDSITQSEVESSLREDVKKFMPEVNIASVIFTNPTNDLGNVSENEINVLVSFTYNEGGYSDTGLLEFNF